MRTAADAATSRPGSSSRSASAADSASDNRPSHTDQVVPADSSCVEPPPWQGHSQAAALVVSNIGADPRHPHPHPHLHLHPHPYPHLQQRRRSTSVSGRWPKRSNRQSRPGSSTSALSPALGPSSRTSDATAPAGSHQRQLEDHLRAIGTGNTGQHTSGKRVAGHSTPQDSRSMESTPFKKPRTGASPPRRPEMLPTASCPPGIPLTREEPFSPLFFSHTPSRQMGRPASASPDVAATMLTRSRDEAASGVTTVKLPHASVKALPSTMSGSATGSMASSIEMAAPGLSPDARMASPSLQLIQSIGAVELVEHDERPTFLIDLSNSMKPATSNHSSINVMFCNASLRAAQDVMQLISLEADDALHSLEHGAFVTWATSVKGGRDTPQQQTYHEYGGITWTSTTIRQRFRFVSGNISAGGYTPTRPPSPMQLPSDTLPLSTNSTARSNPAPLTPSAKYAEPGESDEPADYFGDADLNMDTEEPMADALDSKIEPGNFGPLRHPDAFTDQVLQLQPTKQSFDWTVIPINDDLPDHIKFAKSVDWASTALGAMSDWSQELRAMANLVMASPHPAAMYWGPEHVTLYNEAYIALAGKKHPSLMGMRYQDAWAELWDEVKPVFESAILSGQSIMKHDSCLFLHRHLSNFEETFFDWAVVPIVGSNGEVVGLYNPAFEHTRRIINDRRMLTLREIGERTAAASTVSDFWPQLQKGLEYNELDVPFSIIYSIKEETESDASSLHSGGMLPSSQLVLEGCNGVPEGHPSAPATIDLKSSEDGFAPYLRQCMSVGGAPCVLSELNGTLPKDLMEGFEWRGFGEPCTSVVILPVVPTTTKEALTGFVIMGSNPRRPYDDDYKLFISLLSRQLATSMASVVLFEEEIRRGQRAARLAALDRQELSMQLVRRTQQANESEYRFTRMAEYAPVGMFIADAYGTINYCNDMWFQISRRSRQHDGEINWMSSVRDEDRPALDAAWSKLVNDRITISLEFRFKCSQQSGSNTIDTWVLMSAFPEKTPEGVLKSIFGCITDISSQKWATTVENERREEAVEMKRQQENFIDITSHEMRNPLSAILQCADQISNDIASFNAPGDKDKVDCLLEGCLDAANTINLCASHQKRIVDDILTLSKLDSNLLSVTPVDEQPIKVVQLALKMFEPEFLAHDIEFEFNVDDSFQKYGVTWVKLDPSRLSQVLINLMTNAVKFTQGRERRSIIVTLSASRDVAEVANRGTIYFDRADTQRAIGMDIDDAAEWGTGEIINIHCSVEDTGPGLATEEMKFLFQRFQQATPRTHVQYGGSGLGLFISRILTEMQGGQIGVSSTAGSGSKFNFYIQCRKCVDPPPMHDRIEPFKIERKAPASSSSMEEVMTSVKVASTANSTSESPALFDVLIVEDNIVNQRVLQRQLRHFGNNTFVANHGSEALQTLKKSKFWAGQEEEGVDISVILMDLEMPVMDGMTCARKIRELEREGTIVTHIPIIAVTAYARPEQIEDAKAAGIDDVISKPFRIPELMPKIEELVDRYSQLTV